MASFLGPLLMVAVSLAVAAAFGVIAATAVTCSVGLAHGTDTWCGLGYFWLVGIPIAVVIAIPVGLPLHFAFKRLGLRSWWQYALVGVVFSLPVWYSLAHPFASVRWQQSGPYDTLNYIGTGFFAAVGYFFLSHKVLGKNAA